MKLHTVQFAAFASNLLFRRTKKFFSALFFSHSLLMCTNVSTKINTLQWRIVFQENGYDPFSSAFGKLHKL
jgi:hypothetical protein